MTTVDFSRMSLLRPEEVQAFQQGLRDFLSESTPGTAGRQLMTTSNGYDRATWRRACLELGLAGLTIALVALCLLPTFLGLTTLGYAILTAFLGAWFLARAAAFLRPATRDAMARKLFLCSIAWLPLQLGALVIDRVWFIAP